MAFRDLQFQLKGWIAKLALPFGQTIINDALRKVYEEHDWNWQKQVGGWLTPGLLGGGTSLSPGTVTLTVGSASVLGNAAASALWIATTAAKLKQYQFRLAAYNLYNIIDFDGVNTLTLDRPWMEPVNGSGQTYMIYQAYFPAPVIDFKRFWNVRDFTNSRNLFTDKTQGYLAAQDPQRRVFGLPSDVVPLGTDMRTGSATLGNMLYELWPHQLSILPYALYYSRMGAALSLPTDTLPFPLTEDMILYRARVIGYEWKAAQVGEDTKRGSGANWMFLMQQAEAQYNKRLAEQRKLDRDRGDPFVSKIRRETSSENGFTSIGGYLNVGRF